MTALIFTFGKHRGEPVSVVRNDPGYAFWLLSLHWFRERHPQLRQAVARSDPTSTRRARASKLVNAMTPEQLSNAIDEMAKSGYAGSVAVYLNSVGKAFFGTVAVNDDGLLVVDGGRVFVRCEQVSAIEVSDFAIRSQSKPINRG